MFDINFVRSQFPSLQRNDFIYMDNAGGTQVLKTVADKISDYLLTTNVQTGGTYSVSKLSEARVHEGEVAAAKFINAANIECEAIIGPSATQLVANLAAALEPNIKKEHEFIVTQADHETNIGAFRRLAEKIGCPVKVWKVRGEDHVLDLNDLTPLLNAKTRLVAFTHCSNVLGAINDVKRIVEAIRKGAPNAEVIVDGVAYAPHRRVDVQDLGVDYYILSFYKIYGPHISCLYAKQSSQQKLSSLAHYFISDSMLPYKLQPGGPNYESTYSITAILEYFEALGSRNYYTSDTQEKLNTSFKLIASHEYHLQKAILDFLISRPEHFRIIGLRTNDTNKRIPIISFVVKGWKSSAFVEQIDKTGKIGVKFGHFYAKRLMDEVLQLGDVDGVVRVSCVHYNTPEEVRLLLDKMESIVARK